MLLKKWAKVLLIVALRKAVIFQKPLNKKHFCKHMQ